MDGNKEEALRCVRIAEEAIASGNKARAMKFIRIAQRLNCSLPVEELLAACEKLGSESPAHSVGKESVSGGEIKTDEPGRAKPKPSESLNGEQSYTEEHLQLIRQIRRTNDYYAILGVQKACSVEEIRKAYRKLSLKVHPDKNKAPGSEEAFKKVCKAFKCLSEDDSRRQYNQAGLVEEFEYNQQHNVGGRRRTRTTTRRRTGHDLFDDEFDPDEIFRAFFGRGQMFRGSHAYRTPGGGRTGGGQQREELHGGAVNFMLLLQILPFFVILLLAYLPFSEPDYSLSKSYSYQIPKTTEKHGVEFYVKSSAFDDRYPPGSPDRANIENTVTNDYKTTLLRYCQIERQRRQWSKNLPTPHCNRLHDLGLV